MSIPVMVTKRGVTGAHRYKLKAVVLGSQNVKYRMGPRETRVLYNGILTGRFIQAFLDTDNPDVAIRLQIGDVSLDLSPRWLRDVGLVDWGNMLAYVLRYDDVGRRYTAAMVPSPPLELFDEHVIVMIINNSDIEANVFFIGWYQEEVRE